MSRGAITLCSEHSSGGELFLPLILCCSWVFLWTFKIFIARDLPLVYCNLIPLVQLAGMSEKRHEVISVTVLARYRELYTK